MNEKIKFKKKTLIKQLIGKVQIKKGEQKSPVRSQLNYNLD